MEAPAKTTLPNVGAADQRWHWAQRQRRLEDRTWPQVLEGATNRGRSSVPLTDRLMCDVVILRQWHKNISVNKHDINTARKDKMKPNVSEVESYFWMLLWRLVKFWLQRSSVLRLIVKLIESMQTLSVEIQKHTLTNLSRQNIMLSVKTTAANFHFCLPRFIFKRLTLL